MEYRKLGRSDIDVSLICLGTMTWGEQNTEADAHDQLDYALDHEVNFIDTAEIFANWVLKGQKPSSNNIPF